MKRVIAARERQIKRYGGEVCNTSVSHEILLKHSELTEQQRAMMRHHAAEQHWSNRVQTKVIRIARTISGLQAEESITDEALWEAIAMRIPKKKGRKEFVQV